MRFDRISAATGASTACSAANSASVPERNPTRRMLTSFGERTDPVFLTCHHGVCENSTTHRSSRVTLSHANGRPACLHPKAVPVAGLVIRRRGSTADIAASRERRPLPISSPQTIPVSGTACGTTRLILQSSDRVPAGDPLTVIGRRSRQSTSTGFAVPVAVPLAACGPPVTRYG